MKLLNPFFRFLQRYLIPRFVVSLYYFFRDGVYISNQSRVQLSSQIIFGKGTVVKPYSIIQTQAGRITFGRNCAVSSFDHISTGTEAVVFGDYVRIGPNVTIMGGSRNYRKKDVLIIEQGSYHKGVMIGDDVLIGAGAVIMPGCQVGRGAVIGALSLVNMNVPEYKIVAGIPAKIIGQRE